MKMVCLEFSPTHKFTDDRRLQRWKIVDYHDAYGYILKELQILLIFVMYRLHRWGLEETESDV